MRHLGKTSRLGCVWSISSSSVFFDHWRIEKPLERFKTPLLTVRTLFCTNSTIDVNSEHTSSRVVPGSIAEKAERIENDAMRVGLVNYYRLNGHNISLASLDSFAETYNYAFLDGRRITPTTCSRRGSGSALIQIRYKGEQYSGEIHTILQHKQRGIPRSEPVPLAFVLWMIPGDTPLDNGNFMWNDL
jgi:hypothetical protein